MINRLRRARRPVEALRAPQRRVIEAAVLLVVAVLILVETRMLWFFSDDWAFILGRRELRLTGRTADFLWYPHNEHLMGGLSLIYAAMVAVFGISSQFPFMVLLMLGHVAVTWMVAFLVRRAGVRWEWSLVLLVWLGFFGGGNENLIWPVQIGYVWSLALGLGSTIITLRPLGPASDARPVRLRRALLDLCAALLLTLAIFVGPTAMIVAIATGVALLAERPLRHALVRGVRVLAMPAALYLWWYIAYGRRFSPPWGHPVHRMPSYLVRGVTNALDHVVSIPHAGLPLALAAVALCATRWRKPAIRQLLLLCLAGFVGLFLLNSYARAGLGPVQSTSPRYVGVAAIFAVPVFIMGASELFRRASRVRDPRWEFLLPAVVIVVALVGAHTVWRNARDIHLARRAREGVLHEVRPLIEIAALHALSPVVDPGLQPEPKYDPDITMGRLAEIERSGIWVPHSRWSDEELLTGSVQFGVVVRHDGPTAASANRGLRLVSVDGVRSRTGDCIELSTSAASPASFSVEPGSPGGFVRVEIGDGSPSVEASAQLTSGALKSDIRDLGPVDGAPTWIGVDTYVGSTVVTFVSQVDARVEVCGVSGAIRG